MQPQLKNLQRSTLKFSTNLFNNCLAKLTLLLETVSIHLIDEIQGKSISLSPREEWIPIQQIQDGTQITGELKIVLRSFVYRVSFYYNS